MTVAEILAIFISLLALILSFVTAYRTLFARFRGEIFLKPRTILTSVKQGPSKQGPSIVVGCEISNTSAQSGAIDDFILQVKHRQQDVKGINTYSFFPILSRDDYSIYEHYEETDFEPFQSISVPVNSRLTKYIVFSPSDTNFSPLSGEIKLQLFSRSYNSRKWIGAKGHMSFSIDNDEAKYGGGLTVKAY